MFLILIIIVVTFVIINGRIKLKPSREMFNKLKNSIKVYMEYFYLYFEVGNGHVSPIFDAGKVTFNVVKRMSQEAIINYGVTSFYLGNSFTLLCDGDKAKTVLLKSIERGDDVFNYLKMLVGNSSVIAPEKIWRPRRKALLPHFNTTSIKEFGQVTNEQTDVLMKVLKEKAGTGTFQLFPLMNNYFLDIICETIFGIKLHCQTHQNAEIINKFQKVWNMIINKSLLPWLQIEFIYKILNLHSELMHLIRSVNGFVMKMIVDTRARIKDNSVKTENEKMFKPMMEKLIESSVLNDVELKEESIVLVMAGADTISTGLSIICYVLSKYPDVQEKVYEEYIEVIGNTRRSITNEDISNMKYLDAVVKECLRVFPPLPILRRKLEQDIKLDSDLTLIKGTNVLISIWGIHRNPKHWGPDADKFRPERFLNPEFDYKGYMPFSKGLRSCLGMNVSQVLLKTTIANIIRSYRLYPAIPGSDGKLDDLEETLTIYQILKDTKNYQIKLELRN